MLAVAMTQLVRLWSGGCWLWSRWQPFFHSLIMLSSVAGTVLHVLCLLECNQLYCSTVDALSITLPLVSSMGCIVTGRSIAEGDLVFDLVAYLTSSPCARRVMLQTLQDSFDTNKEIALQLLLELPVHVELFEVHTLLGLNLQYIILRYKLHRFFLCAAFYVRRTSTRTSDGASE